MNLCSSILDLFPGSSPHSIPHTDESKSTLEGIEEGFDSAASGVVWISYDMVHPNDTFGKMMRSVVILFSYLLISIC